MINTNTKTQQTVTHMEEKCPSKSETMIAAKPATQTSLVESRSTSIGEMELAMTPVMKSLTQFQMDNKKRKAALEFADVQLDAMVDLAKHQLMNELEKQKKKCFVLNMETRQRLSEELLTIQTKAYTSIHKIANQLRMDGHGSIAEMLRLVEENHESHILTDSEYRLEKENLQRIKIQILENVANHLDAIVNSYTQMFRKTMESVG